MVGITRSRVISFFFGFTLCYYTWNHKLLYLYIYITYIIYIYIFIHILGGFHIQLDDTLSS